MRVVSIACSGNRSQFSTIRKYSFKSILLEVWVIFKSVFSWICITDIFIWLYWMSVIINSQRVWPCETNSNVAAVYKVNPTFFFFFLNLPNAQFLWTSLVVLPPLLKKKKFIAPEQQMDLIVAEEDAPQLESINLHPLTL